MWAKLSTFVSCIGELLFFGIDKHQVLLTLCNWFESCTSWNVVRMWGWTLGLDYKSPILTCHTSCCVTCVFDRSVVSFWTSLLCLTGCVRLRSETGHKQTVAFFNPASGVHYISIKRYKYWDFPCVWVCFWWLLSVTVKRRALQAGDWRRAGRHAAPQSSCLFSRSATR